MIEINLEVVEVGEVSFSHLSDEIDFGFVFLFGTDRDSGSVGIICADEKRSFVDQLEESDKDIGLDVFDEVAEMDRSVSVRECGGYECFHGI